VWYHRLGNIIIVFSSYIARTKEAKKKATVGRPGKMTHKKAGEDDRKVAIGRSRKKTTLPNHLKHRSKRKNIGCSALQNQENTHRPLIIPPGTRRVY